jgi:TolB-like protein
MRALFSLLAVFLLASIAQSAADSTRVAPRNASPHRTSVVLFDFEADSEDVPQVARRILTDVMRSEIVKSDQFQVIDRAHVQKMLQEQQFQLTGIVNEATMVQMGQIIGAQKIVTGRIGWLGKIRVITLQLIDVSTGRVECLETSDFVGDVEQLRRPVRAATQRLTSTTRFDGRGGF